MIYIASPYTHPSASMRQQRYLAAQEYNAYLLSQRRIAYSPIAHCHPMAENHGMPTDIDYWRHFNAEMLRKASALHILMLEGWKESIGVQWEKHVAYTMLLPISHIEWP